MEANSPSTCVVLMVCMMAHTALAAAGLQLTLQFDVVSFFAYVAKQVLHFQAHMKKGRSQQAHYNLDRLGVQSALHLPIMEASAGSNSNNTRPQALQDALPDMPEDFKQRLATSLAAEFSKKVCAGSHVHSAYLMLMPSCLVLIYRLSFLPLYLPQVGSTVALLQAINSQGLRFRCLKSYASACAHAAGVRVCVC